MIDSHVLAASQNLVETYVELGKAAPNGKIVDTAEFVACTGDLAHPMSNFAAQLNLNPWAVRDLQAIAASRPAFNVYVQPGDTPDYLAELLARGGFAPAYRLVQMIAFPSSSSVYEDVGNVISGERAHTSKFMADQFFARQAPALRRGIAATTASAERLELYMLKNRSRIQGAWMLSEAAGMLGCYNLCVSPGARGKGVGSAIVHWALAEGARRDLPITLQCEPRLEGWYQQLGFRSTGLIDAYSLLNQTSSDIISPH